MARLLSPDASSSLSFFASAASKYVNAEAQIDVGIAFAAATHSERIMAKSTQRSQRTPSVASFSH